MALAITFCPTWFLSIWEAHFPESLLIIARMCLLNSSPGYGFGFTAHMLYLIYFSDGNIKQLYYDMYCFYGIGNDASGNDCLKGLQEELGYVNFFWWVMGCCLITLAVHAFLR